MLDSCPLKIRWTIAWRGCFDCISKLPVLYEKEDKQSQEVVLEEWLLLLPLQPARSANFPRQFSEKVVVDQPCFEGVYHSGY